MGQPLCGYTARGMAVTASHGAVDPLQEGPCHLGLERGVGVRREGMITWPHQVIESSAIESIRMALIQKTGRQFKWQSVVSNDDLSFRMMCICFE